MLSFDAVLSRLFNSRLSYRVVSCRVVSCRVVSCRVVSCRVVSYLLCPVGSFFLRRLYRMRWRLLGRGRAKHHANHIEFPPFPPSLQAKYGPIPFFRFPVRIVEFELMELLV
jgi:hypothetical protein